MKNEWMPLAILKHVYVGLVLEHLCKSLELSCMAEGLLMMFIFFVVDYMRNGRDDMC